MKGEGEEVPRGDRDLVGLLKSTWLQSVSCAEVLCRIRELCPHEGYSEAQAVDRAQREKGPGGPKTARRRACCPRTTAVSVILQWGAQGSTGQPLGERGVRSLGLLRLPARGPGTGRPEHVPCLVLGEAEVANTTSEELDMLHVHISA